MFQSLEHLHGIGSGCIHHGRTHSRFLYSNKEVPRSKQVYDVTLVASDSMNCAISLFKGPNLTITSSALLRWPPFGFSTSPFAAQRS